MSSRRLLVALVLSAGCDASPSAPAASGAVATAAVSAVAAESATASAGALADIGTIGGSGPSKSAPHGKAILGVTSHDAIPNSTEQLERLQVFFQRCYRRELTRDPFLRGQAEVEIAVGVDGAVSDAQISKTTLPGDLIACLQARARALQFDAPKTGAVTVVIPVTFSVPAGR